MSSQNRSNTSLVARKVGIAVLVVGLALGLITAATVFGSSHQPRLTEASEWRFALYAPSNGYRMAVAAKAGDEGVTVAVTSQYEDADDPNRLLRSSFAAVDEAGD